MKACEVIIAIGAGGVGKTTVTSALGVYYALQGFRTLVITVDPARRLLDALSIEEKSSEPSRVDLTPWMDEVTKPRGELYAFMPDLKKEWNDFLTACITHDEARQKIASNHFYQYMADGLSGALEIICSHILFRLMNEGHYDKIILDTPPTSHSISFFDVPKKISHVLEQNVFRALMSRRHSMVIKLTKKLAFFSGGILEKTFERLIGSHFLSELIDFALTIDALYEPLLDRVKTMDHLLKSDNTSYVLVVRPTVASVEDSVKVKSSLKERDINIHRVIINQVLPDVDHQALINEKTLAQKTMTASNERVINQAINFYENKLRLQAQLLNKVTREFKVEKKILYTLDSSRDRSSVLLQLVQNLLGRKY